MDSLSPFPQDDNTPKKTCTGSCGRTLPAISEFFSPQKTGKYGLKPICKECRKQCEKQRRKNPPTRNIVPEAPEGFKRCLGPCGQTLPATSEYFFRVKSGTYGLRGKCKTCETGRPVVKLAPVSEGYKRCSGPCGQVLPATTEYWHHDKNTKNGLVSQCKECRNKKAKARASKIDRKAYHQLYYQKNIERIQAYSKEHLGQPGVRERNAASTRKRRALKRSIGGVHTPAQIKDQLKRQKYKCYYCQKKLQKVKGRYVYHVEHTFPISRVAGTDIPANDISYLVLACPTCNERKHNKFPWEWPEGGRLL